MNQTTSCQRELGEEKLSARVTFVFLLSRALQRTPLRRACRRLGRQTAPAVDRDRVAAAVVDAVAKQSAQAGVAHLLRAVGHGAFIYRTSGRGGRPLWSVRRYFSANLPSRLGSGPPHSTQTTCTCLRVGIASTRSTTYSASQFGQRNASRIGTVCFYGEVEPPAP